MSKQIKVLREWSQEERWSAYDTGTVYYAEVQIGDEKHVFREPEEKFDPYEKAGILIDYRKKEKRRSDLLKKHRLEGLTGDEAIEFMELEYPKM